MRIKRLDGLRALAVLLVALAENNVIDLGWTGVELFFVLSGYLMTRILRDSRSTESYWSRFYLKRAVRVLPLLVIVLLVNRLAFHHLSLLGLAGYALFLGNVMNITPYAWGPLGMLTSIAVGAHFLLLWSIAVRFLDRKTLLMVAIALLLVEPTLRHLYTPYSSSYTLAFNLTPFRLDSLAAGSLLALLVEDAHVFKRLARWSGWAAIVLAAAFLLVSHLLFPWFVRMYNTTLYNTTAYSTLTAMYFFVAAWVLSLKEGEFAERLLSWVPLVFIGRISYGLYLFHPFVNTILKKLFHLPFGYPGEHGNRQIFPLAILISILLSALLYRFVEVPIQGWGERRVRRLELEHGDPPRREQDAIARAS